MASDKKLQPIIIKRKKVGGHGHHGGAWKVAFADFMTAMMAFFLVMWLMGSDEATKAAVANYFNNPTSALRPDLTSKETVPMGDRVGAGDELLKGADGGVPEEMVTKPQRPLIDGETAEAEEEHVSDVVAKMSSSGDKLQIEVVKFSVAESDLFKQGTIDQWTPQAPGILYKLGKLTKHQKGKLLIKGTFGEVDGSYEFQVSRAVAIQKYLVAKNWIEEEKVITNVRKKGPSDETERNPANAGPRFEFTLSP
ncbi:MAG: hypothetical protein H7222_11395 [Methylotenera sp.]|nr:hypothetical protein [Oligoflexia bacterium]